MTHSASLPQLVRAHESFEAIYEEAEANRVGRSKIADLLKRLVIFGDNPLPSQAQIAQGERLHRPRRISPDAINKAVKALAPFSLVTQQTARRHGSGRPSIPLLLGGDRWYSIGVKVWKLQGGQAGIGTICTDLLGNSLTNQHYSETSIDQSQDLPEEISRIVIDFVNSESLQDRILLGVGIDVSGHVRDGSEVVLSSVSQAHGGDLGGDVSSLLKKYYRQTSARFGRGGSVPVIVDNDTSLLAVRETLKPQRAYRDTVVVAVFPDGIGSAAIVNNRVFRGARGAAGEVGHLPVGAELRIRSESHRDAAAKYSKFDFSSPCTCSEERYGHVDCFAPPNRIRGELGVQDLEPLLQTTINTSSPEHAAITTAGGALGLAISSLTSLLNPEKLVVYVPPFLHPDMLGNRDLGTEYKRKAMEVLGKTAYPGALDGLRQEWVPVEDRSLRELGASSAAIRVVDSFIKHGKGGCMCYVTPLAEDVRADYP